MEKGLWLDLVGPENVVITRDFGEPRLRIIDTEAYRPDYLAATNPVLGKSYKDVFLERLALLDQLCLEIEAKGLIAR